MSLQDDNLESNFPNIVEEGTTFGSSSTPQDYVAIKQGTVARAAARKRQVLAQDSLPINIEDFSVLNPDATPEQLDAFRKQRYDQDFKNVLAKNAAKKEARGTRDRTVGEVIQDTAIDVGVKFPLSVAKTGYGLAELTSKALPGDQTLDSVTEGSTFLNEVDEFWAKQMSEPTQFQVEQVVKEQQEFTQTNPSVVDALPKNASAIDTVSAYVEDIGGEAVNTVGALVDNPLAAMDIILSSAPELVVSGGIGVLAKKVATKGLTKDQANDYIASDAGKQVIESIGSKSNISYVAASESMNTAVSAKGKVLDLSHEELMETSEFYRAEITNGVSPEQARMNTSDKVFETTAAIAAATSALTAKVTGAGKTEVSKPNIVKQTATQAIEEPIQSAGSQVAENVATQQFVDSEQSITEGVGQAIGTGFVAGTGIGVAVPTVTNTYSAVRGASKVATKITTETASKIKNAAKVDAVIQSGNTQEVTNTESPEYSPVEAAEVLLDPKFIPESKEDQRKHIADINGHISNVLKEIETLMSNPEPTEEESNLIGSRITEVEALQAQADTIAGALVEDVTGDIAILTSATEATPDTDKAVKRIFGSMQLDPESISLEQQEEIVKSSVLTDDQRSVITNSIEVAKSRKLLSEVSTDIFEGGQGFLGINDYMRTINSSLALEDIPDANNQVKNLKLFAERHQTKSDEFALALSNPDTAQDTATKYGLEFLNESSRRLVDVTKVEADALQAAVRHAESLVNIGLPTVKEPVTPKKVKPEPVSEPKVEQPDLAKEYASLSDAEKQVIEDNAPNISKILKTKKDFSKVSDTNQKRMVSVITKAKDVVASTPVYSRAKSLTTDRVNNNAVASLFKASQPKDTTNKLSTVENFFSAVDKDASIAGKLNDKQAEALPRVVNFQKAFNKTFGSDVLAIKDKKFLHFDAAQMFLDTNDKFDENVISTIGMTAYNWLGTQGTGTMFNDDNAINSILGREDEHEVSAAERNTFSKVGGVRTVLAESLGNEIIKNLGIKALPDASGEVAPNLAMSFGLYAIATLDKMGLVNQQVIKASDFPSTTQASAYKGKTDPKRATTSFVRVNTNTINQNGFDVEVPTNKVKSIGEVIRGSDNLLTNLFGLDNKMVMPTLEPVTEGPKKVVRGSQKVTKKASSIIAKHNSRAQKLKNNVSDVFVSLDVETQRAIAGVKDPMSVHITQRPGVEGKNAALISDIDNFSSFEFVLSNEPKGRDTEFFFQHEVWKNNRVGLVGSTINPQASKFQRHMITNSDHVNTIDPTKPEELEQFKLAVAMSMGVGIDKLTNADSLAQYKELTDNPVVRNAVTAIQKISKGEAPTNEMNAKILAAVKLGGEDTYSFDGLVALAGASSTKSFETNLFMEVDGITNGVIIGLIQMNAGKTPDELKAKLAKGGIYFDGQTESFGEWKKNPLNLDSYEDMAKTWRKELDKQIANKELINSIESLIGEINRKKAKAPLMTTVYGSSLKKVLELFTSDSLDGVYSDIAKANNDQAKLDQISYDINVIANLKGDQRIQLTVGTAIDVELGKPILNKIGMAISRTYGDALEKTIEESFGTFIDKRTKVNTAMDVVFQIFKGSYGSISKERTKLKGSELSSDEKQGIVDSLLETAPILHNYFSQQTGNLEEATVFLKTKKTRQVGKAYLTEQVYNSKLSNGAKRSTGFSSKNDFEAPGVAPAIVAIHSLDAASMVSLMEEHSILNVHDAFGSGIKESTEYAKDFNKIFADIMEQYSIQEAMAETLQRSVKFMKKRYPELEGKLSLKGGQSLDEYVSEFVSDVKVDEASRQELLKSTTYWTQYNIEDGGYNREADFKVEGLIDEVITELKGSKAGVNPKSFNANYTAGLTHDNTLQMFDDLAIKGNVTETNAHSEHLRSLITNTVNQVVKPFNLHLKDTMEAESYGMTDGSEMYIATSTNAVANGIQMSAQEVFTHELIHNITAAGIDETTAASHELKRLFMQAEKVITPADFMNDPSLLKTDPSYAVEMEAATRRYDYIFNNTDNSKTTSIDPETGLESKTSRNNYLHEFLAIGLTNKQFRKALADKEVGNVQIETNKPNTIMEKLVALYNKIVQVLFGRITGTAGKDTDTKMQMLGRQLAGIHHRQEGILGKTFNAVEIGSDQLTKIVGSVINPLIQLAQSDKGKASKRKIVGKVSRIAKLVTTTEYETFSKAMRQVRKNTDILRKGFIASLITETKGRTKNNALLHDLARYKNKVIDQTRLATATHVAKHLISKFQGELTQAEKIAITKTVLRTDMVALTDTYTTQELAEFLGSKSKLDNAIKDTEAKLTAFGNSRFYYAKQARNLGYFMVTGTSLEVNPMLNAHNISRLLNTGVQPTGNVTAAEVLIDELASLYAIQYTDSGSKKTMKEVMDRELGNDPVNNGITFTLQMHNATKQDAKARLFRNQETLIIKGYVKEVFNPDISYKIGSRDELAVMAKEGYKIIDEPLKKDSIDPNQVEQYLYVSKDGLQGKYDAGIASLTSRQAKGSDLIKVRANTGDIDPIGTANVDGAAIYNANEKLAKKMFSITETRKAGNYLVPIMDASGNVSGYRYMMNQVAKDTLLEQTNEFDTLLGGMEASTQDKIDTPIVNRRLVTVMREIYLRDFKEDPKNFVRIHAKSSDKRLSEIYNMLPKEMRADIKRIWGTDGMYVRYEDLDLAFGYRRASVSGLEKSDDPTAAGLRKMINHMNDAATFMLKNRRTKVSENVWREVVGAVKDTIVVKSGSVLVGNLTSNMVLLKTLGVPLKDIITNHGVAFKGAMKHRRDSIDLDQAERELKLEKMNQVDKRKLQVKIARLKDSITNNPVSELIDAGVFQSIVEDVGEADSPYTYKSALGRFVAPVSSRIPKPINSAISNIFLLHDSAGYNLLREITQVSDFAARYALHQYNTNKKKTPMSKAESINMIVSTFINYDLPTHKNLQYANEMGAIMFTKFFVRTQKVIAHILKNNPENVVKLLAIESVIGDVSDIIGDANVLTNDVTDKINLNPLGLVSEIFEPVTVKAMTDAI